MSAEKPWHRHEFRSAVVTPQSCMVCAQERMAEHHWGPMPKCTLALDFDDWKVWDPMPNPPASVKETALGQAVTPMKQSPEGHLAHGVCHLADCPICTHFSED